MDITRPSAYERCNFNNNYKTLSPFSMITPLAMVEQLPSWESGKNGFSLSAKSELPWHMIAYDLDAWNKSYTVTVMKINPK